MTNLGVDLKESVLGIPIPTSGQVDVYSGVARLAGKIWAREVTRGGATPSTAVVLIHPTSNFLGHFALEPLAAAGFGAVGLTTRYVGNDSQALLENTLIDIASAVGFLKQRYEKVVLVGYSGGGAIVPWYQRESTNPVTTSSPCGGGPDLTLFDLPPADAVMLMSAHPSRALMLRDWIDPAVSDELRPEARDATLDMFNLANGPKYSNEWLATYRAAQIERIRRITSWCQEQLSDLSKLGPDAPNDRAFITHGTVADPGYLDLSIAPNDRVVGTYWGAASSANMAPFGPARFCSLRSWLSTWSVETSNGDARKHLGYVTVPVMIVNGTADQGVRSYHYNEMWRCVVAQDRELHEISGGDHYFTDTTTRAQALDVMIKWLRDRNF